MSARRTRRGPYEGHWRSSDWPRELHWAFRPGMGRWRSRRGALEKPYRSYGYLITLADHRLPWGRSTHARGYLSHAVRQVLLAWRDGQFKGGVVQWECGSETRFFELEKEPSGPICPLCTIDRGYLRE